MSAKQCIFGDGHGGSNCQCCDLSETCTVIRDVPACAQRGCICTESKVKNLEAKFKDYNFDGDEVCKCSFLNANGDYVCNAV